jgi:hypothetical protein
MRILLRWVVNRKERACYTCRAKMSLDPLQKQGLGLGPGTALAHTMT